MSIKDIFSRNYVLLCANNYFQFMAHFILMATLPLIATNIMGASKEEVGLINGMYLLGALLSRPIMGRLIDIYEKKKVLLLTFIFFLIPFILYFFVTSAGQLIALRLVHGCVFGALSTATMTTAAGTLPRNRMGEGIGYFAVCMTLGMILGPLVGLSLLEDNYLYVFISSLGFAALVFFSIAGLRRPDTEKSFRKNISTNNSISGWRRFVEPAAIPIGIIAGLTSFAFSSISTFITLYAEYLGQLSYAPYFYMSMAIIVVFSRPRVGKLFDKCGPTIIVHSALLIFAAGLFLLSFTTSGIILVLLGILIGLGNGNLFSSLQALVITVVPANRTGVGTSTYFIFFDGCAALGAILLGPITDVFGFEIMYRISAGILIFDCFLYYFFYQRCH